MLGKQCALRTIFAFDKSLHQSLPRLQRVTSKLPKLLVFSHSFDPLPPIVNGCFEATKIANFPKNKHWR
jgi:hypothetical protein